MIINNITSSFNNKRFLFLFIFIGAFLIFWSIKLIDLYGVKCTLLIRSFLIITEFLLVMKLLYITVIKATGPKNIYRNLLLLFYVFIIVFLTFEFIFMYIPRSHGFYGTLASRIWFAYYWKPVNQLGYRDKELLIDSSKRNILVVGDSFTAGDGIKNAEDRFSNLLEKRLTGYKVFNLGKNGADTKSEYENLTRYPVKLDIVIHQYCFNDIDCPSASKAKAISGYSDINRFLAYFVKFSFLFNYIYWGVPHYDYKNYYDEFMNCYKDEAIVAAHFIDLNKFVEYCNKRKILFIAVIFPFLSDDAQFSRIYTERINKFFRERGIKLLDVTDLIDKIPLKLRIVNVNNPHPSRLLHKLVADRLAGYIRMEPRPN